MKQFFETGKIVATHGLKGEIKVDAWCDSPDFLADMEPLYFDEGKTIVPVISRRVHKRQVLMILDGVDSVEKADKLRGKIIYINRDDVELEEGAVFIQDLIGLKVIDADTKKHYGKITDVFATGANDVYRIQNENKKEYLFPAVPHMIEEINPQEGFITVKPIPGIFDNEGLSDAN